MVDILAEIVKALLPGILAFGVIAGGLSGAALGMWVFERLGLI